MAAKKSRWQIKGMNKDLAVSVFSPELAFECHNLRLSTNENNTQLCLVNEKGTGKITLEISPHPWKTDGITKKTLLEGTPIGTAMIDHQLVIFTTGEFGIEGLEGLQHIDRIYVLDSFENLNMKGRILYEGNLGFNVEYPLETLVSFEANHIKKVYWTDGFNQPRLINIAANESKLKVWNQHRLDEDFLIEPTPLDPSPLPYNKDTYFDFVPSINFIETNKPLISVKQSVSGNGTFAPGVIQYCFTLVNKYGQQTNVIDVTPLYYLVFSDRAASPDTEKVTCCFTITLQNLDTNYDYVRLYSIQRTSLNGDTIVKMLSDIPINREGDKLLTYVDNGTTGNLIDPFELLYVGGKEIKALTMIDKDQTLFLGNITEDNEKVDEIQVAFNEQIEEETGLASENFIRFYNNFKTLRMEEASGFYTYTNTLKNLSHRDISTFKGGETYRFGFQLQKTTGEWSQPIWLGDATNDLYPNSRLYSNSVNLVHAECDVPIHESIDTNVYKRIRPVIVYPNIQDRSVVCQGVLNPTVFNAQDRKNGYPFSQASWYFRPYMFNLVGTNSSSSSPYATTLDKQKIESGVNYDYAIDTDFTAKTVYVLIVQFSNTDVLNNILRERKVYFQAETQELRNSQDIIGGILLERVLVNGYYHTMAALVSETDWYINTGGFGVNSGIPIEDSNGASPVGYTLAPNDNNNGGKPFVIHSGITANSEGYLRYSNKVGEHSTYNFKFCNGGTGYNYYRVTFYLTGSSSTFTTVGFPLNYVHYDSLFTDAEAENNFTSLHKVEIMGSSNIYENVSSPPSENAGKNNTQFFIDQSIVTLNSPDLDFDTDVQAWGTENLKLRIVGAIPITANISSHSIALNSNMLDVNHNKNNDKDDAEFGSGELLYNVRNLNVYNFSGNRLVAEYLWNDVIVTYKASEEDKGKGKDGVTTSSYCVDFLVYPWHRTGSLNNDTRASADASSLVKTKKESNLLFSYNTEFLQTFDGVQEVWDNSFIDYSNINIKTVLTENSTVTSYRLSKQCDTSSEINYYPNIDKVLHNSFGYYSAYMAPTGEGRRSESKLISPISMKYLSTSHFVIAFNHQPFTRNNFTHDAIPILPSASSGGDTVGDMLPAYWIREHNTFWGDKVRFGQDNIDIGDLFDGNKFNFLWLGELYKDVGNRFGGTSKEALLANNWLVAGEAKYLKDEYDANDPNHQNHGVRLVWEDGDTFYQRYDCLKTYAFTKEDPNQIVEILSFMCESHVNLDGRYDKLRGQAENHVYDPTVFNRLNDVYNQQANFFVGKKQDVLDYGELKFPNQIYFSKTKTSGADVDLWTNVTMGSTLELDGDKGELKKLARLGNYLWAFQDTGIAQILYNENVQLSTKDGVPVEIANSGKVQGKRYLTSTVGCSNKWAFVPTSAGIYFIDSNEKSIYRFNGETLTPLSHQKGLNTWCKKNLDFSTGKWNPLWKKKVEDTYEDAFAPMVAYYDKKNQDILFINGTIALAYSEQFDAFTSFYDYGHSPYLIDFDGVGVWLGRSNSADTETFHLWEHQAGEYCDFFDKKKPYWLTLVGNPDMIYDKIFTNLEFKAIVDTDGTSNDKTFDFHLPFDYLEVWNEYQHGISYLKQMRGYHAMLHHWKDSTESLKRKFRTWYCDIPRDNAPIEKDAGLNISRSVPKPLNRIRNPWAYIKLMKEVSDDKAFNRTEIHDIELTYYV